MARVAPAIPEESALLCEKCGYIVNGIPMDSLCPECAAPIAESLPDNRGPTIWERRDGSGMKRFVTATLQLVFTPAKFYRSMNSRADLRSSGSFARVHHWIASVLFGAAAYVHGLWALPDMWTSRPIEARPLYGILMLALFSAAAYGLLTLTTYVAARLTAWEAAYRGLRLPRRVVQRALHYHSAHYLPVALLALATVVGHQVLIHEKPLLDPYGTIYLYVLCGEVILSAVYLFITYWKGMRNLMYANG